MAATPEPTAADFDGEHEDEDGDDDSFAADDAADEPPTPAFADELPTPAHPDGGASVATKPRGRRRDHTSRIHQLMGKTRLSDDQMKVFAQLLEGDLALAKPIKAPTMPVPHKPPPPPTDDDDDDPFAPEPAARSRKEANPLHGIRG